MLLLPGKMAQLWSAWVVIPVFSLDEESMWQTQWQKEDKSDYLLDEPVPQKGWDPHLILSVYLSHMSTLVNQFQLERVLLCHRPTNDAKTSSSEDL